MALDFPSSPTDGQEYNSGGRRWIYNAAAGSWLASNFFAGTATLTGGSINSMPIGATTPSTGAFTSLSATSASLTGALTVTMSGTNQININRTGSALNSAIRYQNTSGSIYAGLGAAGTFAVRDAADISTSPWIAVTSSGLAVTGALSSTTGANFATSSGNVGIGTASPDKKLHISAGTNLNLRVLQLSLDNFTNEGIGLSFSRTSSDSELLALGVVDSDKLGLISREGIIFATGGAALYAQTTERMRITDAGNVGIGTTDQFGGGERVVGIANAGTVPASNPTGGGVLYVEAGALKYRGSSGTVTTIANA